MFALSVMASNLQKLVWYLLFTTVWKCFPVFFVYRFMKQERIMSKNGGKENEL